MISVEKPGSPTEILEHHGTKGMKWGVRNKSSDSSFNKANPTSRDKATAIYRARARSDTRHTTYVTSKGAERKKAKLIYLNHPDRATALRMTRGEKIVVAVLAGAFAPTVVVPAAAATSVGGQRLMRRHVERKQARGGYK